MAPKINFETQRRIDIMYPPEKREDVKKLLEEECGYNLPLPNLEEASIERFRFAALKISNGDFDVLKKAVDLAKLDLRDLQVAAGFNFGHKRWPPKGMGPQKENWWVRRRKRLFGFD